MGSALFLFVGASLQRLLIRYNQVVRPQLFVMSKKQCHSPNTYFDGNSTCVRNKQVFVITVAIVSGLDCICVQYRLQMTDDRMHSIERSLDALPMYSISAMTLMVCSTRETKVSLAMFSFIPVGSTKWCSWSMLYKSMLRRLHSDKY